MNGTQNISDFEVNFFEIRVGIIILEDFPVHRSPKRRLAWSCSITVRSGHGNQNFQKITDLLEVAYHGLTVRTNLSQGNINVFRNINLEIGTQAIL